jgi:HAD superfamily hydrolase (TIGR01459 family)
LACGLNHPVATRYRQINAFFESKIMTQIITALSEISARYDALFVDLWGCVHNGVAAIPSAVSALQDYRKTGGKVILVTNSPRPRANVETQLETFGVARDCWDDIASSGDSARSALFRGTVGSKVWFIGQPHDQAIFDPIEIVADPITVTQVPLDQAEGIVCMGPVDPQADPSVMRPQFLMAKQMGLKLLCANPDIVVDRGDVREWCAGALAQLYTEMGGESLYFGKPHPPIYDLARRRLFNLGADVPNASILAIGDGVLTDIQGAMGEDIDSLFISGGLAAAETKTTHQPDPELLSAYLNAEKSNPTFTIGHLR